MLISLQSLHGWKVQATDGEIGQVADFLFDEQQWTVRYLVVDTGDWFLTKRVLLSPYSVEAPLTSRALEVGLTRDQVRSSPPLQSEMVPRRYETDYAAYYGYPQYWVGPGLWGHAPSPVVVPPPPEAGGPQGPIRSGGPAAEPGPESHLKSVRAVRGYHIHASDGEIGHLDDLYIDDRSWQIRYLLVDTSNWIGGKPVLVPHERAGRVDWIELLVHVEATRDEIRRSPEFNRSETITSEHEESLRRHYSRVGASRP